MPRPKPKATPKPMFKCTVEYMEEDWDVEIICPTWALHKVNGGEPSDRFEEEGGESMWELYVTDQGAIAAKKAFAKRAAKEAAEAKAADDKRVASLKKSFDFFDSDGSGTLTTDEVLEILTRMTAGGTPLSKADAEAFIKEFDRDGDGEINFNEFIVAMGVVSDAVDADGDGVADVKDKGSEFEGAEDKFAEKLTELEKGETLQVAGMEAGKIAESVEDARRVQK